MYFLYCLLWQELPLNLMQMGAYNLLSFESKQKYFVPLLINGFCSFPNHHFSLLCFSFLEIKQLDLKIWYFNESKYIVFTALSRFHRRKIFPDERFYPTNNFLQETGNSCKNSIYTLQPGFLHSVSLVEQLRSW